MDSRTGTSPGLIEIVPYAAEHQSGIIGLILPIQQSEFGVSITLGDQPDLLVIPEYYQTGCGNFWVALAGGEVVGSVALRDMGSGRGALRKMFVRSQYRGAGHGVAGRLLESLLEWCRERQVREVFLGTTAMMCAAHRFYEKWGFSEIARSDLPASFPVMAVDTKFYSRHVAPA
jgi:N-acetylglutamate synthase-like GNAT family acetyltransferase